MRSTANRPYSAAALVLGGMGLFGLIDNFMRLAAETGGLWQFHLLRSVIALTVLFPLAWIAGISLSPMRPSRVAMRSVLNSIAIVIYFGCLGFMPIAQVVAGLFTAPIFVVIFSMVLFGEKVGPRRVFAVILGFVGIILALRPEAGDLSVWTVVPVVSGALYGLGNLVTRRWCADEDTMTILVGFFGMMMIWGALGSLFLFMHPLPVPEGGDGFITRGWVPPEGIFLTMIIVQAIGSLIGVGMSIKAYQLADATMVAVFENTLLVFATFWAFVLWGQAPDALGLLGLALITVAGIIIAMRSGSPAA
ncbi:MAG: DMT family transporter [Rhodobacterales bacterium]|nr:DMT family transporter [Rhodobacterales bacterium]